MDLEPKKDCHDCWGRGVLVVRIGNMPLMRSLRVCPCVHLTIREKDAMNVSYSLEDVKITRKEN